MLPLRSSVRRLLALSGSYLAICILLLSVSSCKGLVYRDPSKCWAGSCLLKPENWSKCYQECTCGCWAEEFNKYAGYMNSYEHRYYSSIYTRMSLTGELEKLTMEKEKRKKEHLNKYK